MHNTTESPEKHIMIAMDPSESSKRAALYVADMLGGLPDFRITLFSLVPVPPDEHFQGEEERASWIEKEKAGVDELLHRMREVCLQAGFPEDKVETISEARHCPSVADALIDEARAIGACTLVVGRRGLSMKEEFLFGSTSSRVLHDSKNCAVWVVE